MRIGILGSGLMAGTMLATDKPAAVALQLSRRPKESRSFARQMSENVRELVGICPKTP